MKTIHDWVNDLGIQIENHFRGVVESGGAFEASGNMVGGDMYTVRLFIVRGEGTVELRVDDYQQAVVLSRSENDGSYTEPTVADVLNGLHSNAQGVEAVNGFEGWIDEYYYDQKKSWAEWQRIQKSYNAIVAETAALKELIGEESWNDFLYETEWL